VLLVGLHHCTGWISHLPDGKRLSLIVFQRFNYCFLESLGAMFRQKPIPLTGIVRLAAPDMFEKHDLWWSSPPWGCIILLSVSRICAFRYRPMSFSSNLEPVCILDSAPCWDLDSRYSSWPELLRITVHLYRFLNRFRMLLECTFTCSEFAFRENPKSQTLLAHNHAIRHISQWNLGSNMAVSVT